MMLDILMASFGRVIVGCSLVEGIDAFRYKFEWRGLMNDAVGFDEYEELKGLRHWRDGGRKKRECD
jgi:hypothetical protein